ncbi:protein phosphatase 2C domain-containing protein [Geodermatophilus sp. URMC 62]|uniref:protein phosphatase 2C domain-containing protein n=1 Tax=Geodermatophilus sp. URMC 62 TaxID=3423414 RepID=UPI00406CF402
MTLRILDHITEPSLDSNVNEDAWGATDNAAWVIDGATSLSTARSDLESDARWHAQTLSRELKHQFASGGTDPVEALRAAIESLAQQAGNRYEGQIPPSSSVAVVTLDDRRHKVYRYAVLGDVTILYLNSPSSEALTVRPIRQSVTENALIQEYVTLRGTGMAMQEAHEKILRKIEERRAWAMNTANGYWIASLDPAAADHAICGSIPRTTSTRILLMTDGFAAAQRYGCLESWEPVASAGLPLELVLRCVRSAEKADADCTLHPRLKRSDDATAVLFFAANALDQHESTAH